MRGRGFAQVAGSEISALLGGAAGGWEAFVASWNRLGPDLYMADGGRYRRRRHAVFQVAGGEVVRQPHQPHWQSRDYNPLNGGVQRWFDPVEPAVAEGAVMRTLMALCADLFSTLEQAPAWRVEMHQFRIEAKADEAGRPTPEGAHRDGVDFVLVMLVGRANVGEGVTQVFDPDGRELGAFTLADPMDAVFLDDRRVLHGVTPIRPLDPARPAFRDALVLTFKSEA